MKYIKKGSPPPELARWFKKQPSENGRRINCSYEEMGTPLKNIIKARLLHDQGWLCCYTGIHIEMETSHIEHFIPQSKCENNEDVDYNNMLAAYPKGACRFGGQARANKTLPISPLHRSCETKFRFNKLGEISPADPNDADAKATINILHLRDEYLTELRAHAIDEVLFPHGKEPSDAQLKIVIAEYCERMPNHRFRSFCFVIVSAAEEMRRKRKKVKAQQKAIRPKKRK